MVLRGLQSLLGRLYDVEPPYDVYDFLVTDRLRQFCRTPVPNCQQVIERALHAVA